jgi:hypothetical protein
MLKLIGTITAVALMMMRVVAAGENTAPPEEWEHINFLIA